MLKTYGRHVGEKLSMVDFVSVMMRWNRRIASSNGVAVRFFMPDAHDHGDEHQCAAEQTRSEHRRIEPMTLHTHDNQHDELRQQRRAPTQYSEMLFAYTVRGLFVHTASMGKSGGMPQANMRVVVGECGLSTPSACHPHLSTSQRDSAHRKTLRNAARRSATKKEDPPKRAFLQESSEQNRCTTTSS